MFGFFELREKLTGRGKGRYYFYISEDDDEPEEVVYYLDGLEEEGEEEEETEEVTEEEEEDEDDDDEGLKERVERSSNGPQPFILPLNYKSQLLSKR